MRFELVECPHCGLPADVINRYDLPSTAGDVAHIQTACVQNHIYNGPEERT